MITALFPKGSSRTKAAQMYATIVVYINSGRLADARLVMFQLLDFTLQQYNAGKLIGGYSLTTQQQVLAFEIGLYCTVSLSPTGLVLPGNPTDGGTVDKVVYPSTTTQNIVTPNGNAGVQIPGGSINSAVLVTITPLSGTFPSGPLNTTLDQYGPFSDVKVSPETAIISDVSVGICPSAAVVPATVFLAHNISATSIQVLPPGGTISGLCGITTGSISGRKVFDLASNGDFANATKLVGSALANMLLPQNANATGGGITGTTRTFSPFGGVDTKVYMTTNSTTPQNAPAGSAVSSPPSVLVKTQSGTVVPQVNVLFSVTYGGGTIGGASTSTVATGTNGVATVSDWVINAGPDTVLAVGTYANPSVTFLSSSAAGFPQAVTVDPTAGLKFAAFGDDVIPYGSSYLYTSGTQGFDAAFGTTDFSTTGWLSANGPFGTGDQGGTVCAINSDPNFVPNHKWPLNSDLLLFKPFSLPAGWNKSLTISAAIDNDVIMYVNGHPLTTDGTTALYAFPANSGYSFDASSGFVSHEGCAVKGQLTFTVPASFLVTGQNTLAVRARDRGSVDYIDLKVTAPNP